MREILSKMRAACDRYHMIRENDCVAVGVSGGKDSLLLLAAMKELSRFYPERFTVKAITADPCFFNEESDFSAIERYCEEIGVEYIIKRTELYRIIFETRSEKNPCSLCARMRRGILHDLAKANGCNKIALGHHYDDAVETFFMNLLNGGAIGCFSPVTYLSNKDLYMIRPLIFTEERQIERAVRRYRLPVVQSRCPADKHTKREDTKELIKFLERDYPDLKAKVTGAMQRSEISGW